MQKIVYNACFGNFALSQEAIARYCELAHCKMLSDEAAADIERADKYLVRVVEEMGEAANGKFADLRIAEIPDGMNYVINKHDGLETVGYNATLAISQEDVSPKLWATLAYICEPVYDTHEGRDVIYITTRNIFVEEV